MDYSKDRRSAATNEIDSTSALALLLYVIVMCTVLSFRPGRWQTLSPIFSSSINIINFHSCRHHSMQKLLPFKQHFSFIQKHSFSQRQPLISNTTAQDSFYNSTGMEPRQQTYYNKNAVSVKQIGYQEDKNYPSRQNMEDQKIIIDNYLGDGSGLYAIFDGHGGSQVSEYCANVVPNIFEQEYEKDKNNVKGVMCRVMSKTDDQLKLVGASDTGTTCCLAFVRKQGNSRTCFVANLGDTRAVLSIDGTAKRVTIDHKPTTQSQIERIKKEGGVIVKGRVSGQLAVTRALGDLQLKTEGVSNVPDVEQFAVNDRTKLLIIASDGLWDVCEDQKAVDLVKSVQNANSMATMLVKHAKMNGSKDNISVIVLKF